MSKIDKILSEVYFSTDAEFNGKHPPRNSMLSFASVAFTLQEGIIDTYSANLKLLPNSGTVASNMEFWAKFPEQYAATRENQQAPCDAMAGFKQFIDNTVKGRSAPGIFLEYPGSIDFFWLHWYFLEFIGEDPFRHSWTLGVKSYMSAMMKQPIKYCGKRTMKKNWFASNIPHTHIALDDALSQAHISIRMMCEHLEQPLPPNL